MKKKRSLLTYLMGMATAFVLSVCVTTVLAASGAISFNRVSISLNDTVKISSQSDIKLASGVFVPGNITYTDELGGGTTYVPIREIAKMLDIPVEWNPALERVNLFVDGELGLKNRQTNSNVVVEPFTEVDPINPESSTTLLKQTEIHENFTKELCFDSSNGRYISVTVENAASNPIEFNWGRKYDDGNGEILVSGQVPAKGVVTRTFMISEKDAADIEHLLVCIGYFSDYNPSFHATISVVQFDR